MMKHHNKKIYNSFKELYRIHKLDKINSEATKIASEFCIFIYGLNKCKIISFGHTRSINEIISIRLNIFNELLFIIDSYIIILHKDKDNDSYKFSLVIDKNTNGVEYILSSIPTTEFYKEFKKIYNE